MLHKRIYFAVAAFAVGWLILPAARAQDAALVTRLQNAERDQSLDDPALKPWHLKMAVQLYDPKGKPAQSGTIEEWWAGPHRFRRLFAFPSYSAIELNDGDKHLRTTGKSRPPYLMRLLLEDIVHPIHVAEQGNHFRPELRSERVGGTLLDCIVLHPLGVSTIDPEGFLRYCFRPGETSLLLRRGPARTDALAKIAKFQDKKAAAKLEISMGGIEVASEEIEEVSIADAAAAWLDPVDGLTEVENDPISIFGPYGPKLIRREPPSNPRALAGNHLEGSVEMLAVVGIDGRVRDLNLLASPDDNLSTTAMNTVRQFRYEPYDLSGTPAPVEFIVVLNFSFHERVRPQINDTGPTAYP